MILVTVGAYDLPFDRLIKAVDSLVNRGVLAQDVFMQIGHSVTPSSNVTYERFVSYDRINALAREADLIISQGGPGSIMLALSQGKIPIVVPRQKQFGEMVDDHQVLFAQKLASENKILPIYNIGDLADACENYAARTSSMHVSPHALRERATDFCRRLEDLILNARAVRRV